MFLYFYVYKKNQKPYQAFISLIGTGCLKNTTILTAAIRCYLGGMGESILGNVQRYILYRKNIKILKCFDLFPQSSSEHIKNVNAMYAHKTVDHC